MQSKALCNNYSSGLLTTIFSGSHPKHVRVTKISQFLSQPFHSQDLISNSPYYLPYSFYDVSLENLVLDHLKVP